MSDQGLVGNDTERKKNSEIFLICHFQVLFIVFHVRKVVEKRPEWVKYWKHGSSKYTNMNLPKVEISEGKIHPAGHTYYNKEEAKLYRKIETKLSTLFLS